MLELDGGKGHRWFEKSVDNVHFLMAQGVQGLRIMLSVKEREEEKGNWDIPICSPDFQK